jgi:hypothetical protein
MSSFVQIPYQEAVQAKLRIPHTIANVSRHKSYFEHTGGIRFEVFSDDSGLGDLIVAIIRFSTGELAAIGTRPTTMNRGVELFCASPETEPSVLAAFKQAFPEVTDAEIYTRQREAEHINAFHAA